MVAAMTWLIIAALAFVASVLFAGWLLLRSGRDTPKPLSLAEELVAYKMANEKYRGRLSPKQRVTLNQAYRAATRPRGGGTGPY